MIATFYILRPGICMVRNNKRPFSLPAGSFGTGLRAAGRMFYVVNAASTQASIMGAKVLPPQRHRSKLGLTSSQVRPQSLGDQGSKRLAR